MKTNIILAKSGHSYCLYLLLFMFFNAPASAYDPMAPPGYERGEIDNTKRQANTSKKVKSRDFILRQIVIYPNSKSAVINGYVVHEGSYLKGALVKKINDNTVELMVLGKKKVLTLEAKLPRIRR